MSYATLDDVRARLGKVVAQLDFGDSGAPLTEAQGEAILDQIAGEIDSRLAARGIAVPVASPAHFLALLSAIESYGGSAQILRSWFPDVQGPGEQPAYAYWQELYEQGMASLEDGSGIPASVPTDGDRVIAATHLTEHPDENPDLGAQANPAFTRGKVW